MTEHVEVAEPHRPAPTGNSTTEGRIVVAEVRADLAACRCLAVDVVEAVRKHRWSTGCGIDEAPKSWPSRCSRRVRRRSRSGARPSVIRSHRTRSSSVSDLREMSETRLTSITVRRTIHPIVGSSKLGVPSVVVGDVLKVARHRVEPQSAARRCISETDRRSGRIRTTGRARWARQPSARTARRSIGLVVSPEESSRLRHRRR